jgi:hypothetical protein
MSFLHSLASLLRAITLDFSDHCIIRVPVVCSDSTMIWRGSILAVLVKFANPTVLYMAFSFGI